ncbi:hypothetical protein DYH09_15260 [bacterium CPR1]|nr:hypothetical protein [bacterium CPR1]
MDDAQKESVFAELLQHSWSRYEELFHNERMDDVLLGAVVASCVREGYQMLELNSDGVNHYVRFELPGDHSRLIFRLRHLAEELAVSKVLGHLAEVVVGYGERVEKLGARWSSLRSEVRHPFLATDEPGVVTFDAELSGGYLYAQIPLLLDLGTYLKHDLEVDVPLIRSHLDSAVHALKRVLRGRLELTPS